MPSSWSKRSGGRTPFIGRRRERELLAGDLVKGPGLFTITGPSGMGKTRLALQVTTDVASSFEDEGGVWFTSLATCQGEADVEAAVARSLGIPQRQGRELARAMANRGPMLLVLDNLDPVTEKAGALLGLWLDRCPELRMLATSILPSRVEGEVRFELGPLEPLDAVNLYLERAHRAWAGRSFSDADQPMVEELVGRLDRIPLAIELAAARVRVLPPRALLSRFGERLDLLRSDEPGRQGSLLEALALTWELLSKEEQEILARASVFEGGFTFDAAAAILREGLQVEMLDVLDGLRSKALLQIDESEPPRFTLYESVQAFAHRELERSGSVALIRDAHARYFLETGEATAERLEGPDSLHALGWLKAERENLVAVHGRYQEKRPEFTVRAGLVLAPLLVMEGHGIQLLETTVQAARAFGDPTLLARSLGFRAVAISPLGRADEGLIDLEEALALVREVGNLEEEGQLLVRLGSVHLRRNQIEAAVEPLQLAIRIGRELNAPLLEGSALMTLGAGEHTRRNMEVAEQLFNQAIFLLRRHGFERRESLALSWLAGVWTSQGRLHEARHALLDALGNARKTGNRVYEGNVLVNFGALALAGGLLDEAERSSMEALEIQREVGDLRAQGIATGNLGILALERGDLELAEARLTSSLGILGECGAHRLYNSILPFLAVVQAASGRLGQGRRTMDEAIAAARSADDLANLTAAELLEGLILLSEARVVAPTQPEEAAEMRRTVRERLARSTGPGAPKTGSSFEAIRLLERALEEDGDDHDRPSLEIGRDAAYFELAEGGRVDLRRRTSLRRMLEALAQRRLDAPGQGLAAHELFAAGWPGVEIEAEAAMRRVYINVWILRDLGLSNVLLHQTDGYLLDPQTPLLRRSEA